MNMRKNGCKKSAAKRFLSPPALLILQCGLPVILLSLLGISFFISENAPLTKAAAVYVGGMLEYPVAALMILTVGAILADIAYRQWGT